jgi:hypothetical protein
MASSRFLITSQTLASSAASVTFSSIPATYTDLVVRSSVRWDDAGYASLELRLNGSTTNDSSTELYVYDVTNSGSSRYTTLSFGGTISGTGTSNTFSSNELYIPNYAGSTNKPSSLMAFAENNSGTTGTYISATANLWSNTAAVTSIILAISSGNIVAGSSFYLYGLKNS